MLSQLALLIESHAAFVASELLLMPVLVALQEGFGRSAIGAAREVTGYRLALLLSRQMRQLMDSQVLQSTESRAALIAAMLLLPPRDQHTS